MYAKFVPDAAYAQARISRMFCELRVRDTSRFIALRVLRHTTGPKASAPAEDPAREAPAGSCDHDTWKVSNFWRLEPISFPIINPDTSKARLYDYVVSLRIGRCAMYSSTP